MKKFLLSALLLSAALVPAARCQTATVQLIHNAADPLADTVDIYVNGSLILDDFAFHAATPYMNIPAGIPLEVGIAPASSTAVTDTVKNFEFNLTTGQVYCGMLTGVINPGNFAPNPQGVPTALDFIVVPNMHTVSQTPGKTEFLFIHGITDAETADLVRRNDTVAADNVRYRDAGFYNAVNPGMQYLDITDSLQDSILVTYAADFTGYDDSTVVVFTSGFRDTSVNQGGPVAGLFAAFGNGMVVEFTPVAIAYLQAIHNCADPAADSIDIYALGFLAVDNFRFRTATNYLEVPAGIPIDVGVAPGNSTSINDTIRNFPLVFENGKNYIAMASGVLDTTAFAANPDGRSIAFNMLIRDGARVKSGSTGTVDYLSVHGCTDGITMDITDNGSGTVIIDNAAYGDITNYITAPAAPYYVNVTDASNSTTLGTYLADITPFAGQSAVIFSSGFRDPASNQNGASFGLFAALPDGSVYPFPEILGIAAAGGQEEFSAFPNPADEYLFINDNLHGKARIAVSDVCGRSVMNQSVTGGTGQIRLHTASLKAGVYMLRMTDENITRTCRVVISHPGRH